MFATRLFSMLLIASTVGCAGLQDAEFAVYNWASAEKNWLTSTTSSDRWSISSDYRKGWKDGFRAQLNGTGCYGPAAPPPCYWSPKYRDCDGKEAVAQWYAGWHAGVAAAQCHGDHRLPVGDNPPRLFNSNRNSCAVQEGCNCALPSNNMLPCGNSDSNRLLPAVEEPSPSYIAPIEPIQPVQAPVELPLNQLPQSSLDMDQTSGLIGPVGSGLVIELDRAHAAEAPISN